MFQSFILTYLFYILLGSFFLLAKQQNPLTFCFTLDFNHWLPCICAHRGSCDSPWAGAMKAEESFWIAGWVGDQWWSCLHLSGECIKHLTILNLWKKIGIKVDSLKNISTAFKIVFFVLLSYLLAKVQVFNLKSSINHPPIILRLGFLFGSII